MELKQLLQCHTPPDVSSWHLTNKDMQKFFWKFKGLEKQSQRNIAFWSATNENLKEAYEILDKQERELEHLNGLKQKVFDNINQGILLLDKNFKILDQYSQFLKNLFKKENFGGYNFLDLIYPKMDECKEDRDELEKFLRILLNNVTANKNILQDVNPLKCKTIQVFDKKYNTFISLIIDVQFMRIYEKGKVENILVILEDKTQIIQMQEKLDNEKKRYEAEIETFSAILRNGPKAFIQFIKEAQRTLNLFEIHLDQLNDDKIIDLLFREMHSLKGNAKYFELFFIEENAHKVEDLLSRVKNKKKNDHSEINNIKKLIDRLFRELENIENLNDKVLKYSLVAAKVKSNRGREQLQDFLKTIKEMTIRISKEIGKEIRIVIFNKLEELPVLNKVKTAIIHMIRNSLDHGMEDSIERVASGKSSKGNIKISIYSKSEYFFIEVADDGRGIDFDKVEQKALNKGMIKEDHGTMTHDELLKLIFKPDFSSKDEVSGISGRGYGLDIVKEAVERLKGKITVTTKKGIGTKFILKIPEIKEESV